MFSVNINVKRTFQNLISLLQLLFPSFSTLVPYAWFSSGLLLAVVKAACGDVEGVRMETAQRLLEFMLVGIFTPLLSGMAKTFYAYQSEGNNKFYLFAINYDRLRVSLVVPW